MFIRRGGSSIESHIDSVTERGAIVGALSLSRREKMGGSSSRSSLRSECGRFIHRRRAVLAEYLLEAVK